MLKRRRHRPLTRPAARLPYLGRFPLSTPLQLLARLRRYPRSEAEPLALTVVLAYSSSALTRLFELGGYALLIAKVSPTQIGIYSTALIIVLLITETATWGAGFALIREFSSGRTSLGAAAAKYLGTRSVSGVVCIALGAVILARLGNQRTLIQMFLVLGVSQMIQVLQIVYSSWLRGRGHQSIANAISTGFGLSRLACVFALVGILGVRSMLPVLYGYAVVSTLSLCVTSLVAYRLSRSERAERRHRSVGLLQLYKEGSAFAGSTIMWSVQGRFDWLLVVHFTSPAQLATYGLANKLYEFVQSGTETGLATLFPFVCRDQHGDVDRYAIDLAFGSILWCFGAAALLIGAFGVHVLLSFVPKSYEDAYSIVPLFMIAVIGTCYSGILYRLTAAARHDRPLAIVTVVATAFQVITDLLLIPRIGLLGGALGMVVLVVAGGVGYSGVVYRLGLLTARRLAAYAAGAGCLMCSILPASQAFGPPVLRLCLSISLVVVAGRQLIWLPLAEMRRARRQGPPKTLLGDEVCAW